MGFLYSIAYRAMVTLVGPTVDTVKNVGVDKIHVGFMQQGTFNTLQGIYGGGKKCVDKRSPGSCL